MAKRNENQTNPLGVVRRSIWYVLRTVLIISLLLGLAFAVFTEGMYISNMFIIVTEGMELRANAVLENDSTNDLRQYFSQEFIDSDELLNSGAYQDYAIESFDYRYSIKGFRVLPWGKTGTVTYTERIPTIIGTPIQDDVAGPLPQWESVKYKVQLTKVDGSWLISGLIVLEENPEEEVRPTPDYSQLQSSAVH